MTYSSLPYVTSNWYCNRGMLILDRDQRRCLCSPSYFGEYCDKIHANITIQLNSIDHPTFLLIVLIQFAGVTKRDDELFKNILLFEHVSTQPIFTVYHVGYEQLSLMVFCKIFYSSSMDHYASYLVFYLPYRYYKGNEYPTSVQTKLGSNQRCRHVREMEILKSTIDILSYPYIKGIQFYILGCSSGNNTRCFCHEDRNKLPSYITYDHTQEICKKSNYCLNEGSCVENRRSGSIQFSCLCPKCSY